MFCFLFVCFYLNKASTHEIDAVAIALKYELRSVEEFMEAHLCVADGEGPGDERVSEPEGGRGEAVHDPRVERRVVGVVLVVVREVGAALDREAEPVHDLWSEQHGQPLVEGDVLHHGPRDLPRLAEQRLVVPARVHQLQVRRHAVVLAVEHRVHRRQTGVLVHARVACK